MLYQKSVAVLKGFYILSKICLFQQFFPLIIFKMKRHCCKIKYLTTNKILKILPNTCPCPLYISL